MEIDLSGIIATLATIVTAYFAYNQYTRNKMTDLKVDVYKKDLERKSYKRSENTAKVFGELWNVLYRTKADRVYIVQPHPLGHSEFLSVQFEVKRKGVSGMKDSIQELPMGEIAVFSKSLAENLFLYFADIDTQVNDKQARSLLSVNGCKSVAIKRLNSATDWVGNIFCDFNDPPELSEDEIHKALHDAAVNIQFILPEYKGSPK